MPAPRRHVPLLVTGCTLLAMLAVTAPAVTTSHWTQTTEADFKKGTFHNVVATNLGDLKLSRAVKTLLDQNTKVSTVFCLAEGPDHTVYAGTGPQGVLLQVKDDKVTTLLTLDDDTNILSLLVDKQGRLLVGTGGETGRVLRIDKPGAKPVEIFKEEDVQYVWSLVQTPDGTIYAATGPEGQLFQINPDGSHVELFKSHESNLLSMISDGKDLLYIGTDPNGLVYRFNRKTKQSFVLYDAGESEVKALALDAKGNLYAATAETGDNAAASDAAAESAAAAERTGRPETAPGGGVPIPSQPPENPEPPKLPDPNPGEPVPIPKATRKMPTRLPASRQPPLYFADVKAPSNAPTLLVDDPADPAAPGGPGQPNPGEIQIPMQHPATQPSRTPVSGETTPHPEGNAIYKIDPDGFVTEVFRQSVEIHSMIERNGVLLFGTGSEGLIYQLDPTADEHLIIAKVDAKEVTALLAGSDGRVFLGMANSGALAAMSAGFADSGTFTSPVLDANQVSRFGKLHLEGTLPKASTLTVATRSGNVEDADDPGWSPWSNDVPAAQFVETSAPPARYFQYRLTFATTDANHTPVVEDADVAYQTPNLPPIIKSVKIGDVAAANSSNSNSDNSSNSSSSSSTPSKPSADRKRTITWESSDPNNDTLSYSLYFRSAGTGPWILLKDKLKDATYDWDTRTVADGRYELKVIADDSKSNPPGSGKAASRVSDPVIIDNTAPVIGDVQVTVDGNKAKVQLRVVDRTSTVAAVHYAIDSSEDWQLVLPTDGIYDSASENVTFSTRELTPGPHQLTISATDSHGNESYETIVVTGPQPTASK